MKILKLIFKNARRHLLRSLLTIIGVAIAVTAFCVIRSAIDAWYLNSKSASPNRLITRSAISLTFNIPIAYKEKILKVPGVVDVSNATWFGGVYVDESNFFPKFAVDHTNYFKMYPEYIVKPEELEVFNRERNAIIVGRALADRFGWEIGEQINLVGDIYPGNWNFVIRGIYTGVEETTNENTWFHQFEYHDERLRQETPVRAGLVSTLVIQIDNPERAAQISDDIDVLFVNSLAETKTETEEAFRLSFVSMSSSLILGMRIISYLILVVVLMVLANTMSMAARERIREYALIKTLGFRTGHILGIVFGESLFIAVIGGVLGILLAFKATDLLGVALSVMMPKVPFTGITMIMAMAAAIVVGLIAAVPPSFKAVRTSIVDGLRAME